MNQNLVIKMNLVYNMETMDAEVIQTVLDRVSDSNVKVFLVGKENKVDNDYINKEDL